MTYDSPPPGYNVPPPGYYGMPPQDHPQATIILVLGILSLVLCSFLGPVAWTMGRRALTEIDAAHGAIGGRGQVQAGMICGIVATCLLVLLLLFFVFAIVVGALGSTSA
ncbi:hypothetical protein [Nocardia crassostreae]|uniref:hypothetical protein n=1 Tax=Nocardia crassostreae TaxID=53428 RepID=UPI0009FCA798|nr:hypothetical protein [Nocardia crassostreae]